MGWAGLGPATLGLLAPCRASARDALQANIHRAARRLDPLTTCTRAVGLTGNGQRRAGTSPFRLSKGGRGRKAWWRSGRLRGSGVTHAYLGARRIAAQVVESGRRETAHSKREAAVCRAQAETGARQGRSCPVRLWRARARAGCGRRVFRSCARRSVAPRSCRVARGWRGRARGRGRLRGARARRLRPAPSADAVSRPWRGGRGGGSRPTRRRPGRGRPGG
jgi:hypothetical protein